MIDRESLQDRFCKRMMTTYWHIYKRRYPFEWRWYTEQWITRGWLPKDFFDRFRKWDEIEKGWKHKV